MDPTNEAELPKLESLEHALLELKNTDEDVIEFIELSHGVFDTNGERIDPNFTQLDRVLKSIALLDGLDARQTYRDLLDGASIAFRILLETEDDDEDIRAKLYAALGSFETQAINKSDQKTPDRQIAIGTSMQYILDNDLIFSALDTGEEQQVAQIMTEFQQDEKHQYDALRGYRLVRMIIPWAENRRQYVLKKLSALMNIQPTTAEEGGDVHEEVRDKVLESVFFDMVDRLEVEDRILDGLEECNEDIEHLNILRAEYLSYMAQSDITDPNLAEQTNSALLEAMFNEFMGLKNIKLRDTLTILGNSVVLIYDAKGDFKIAYALTDGEIIRGVVVEPNIMSVPSQAYVDAASAHDERLLKKIRNKSSEPFGLTFLLDKATIQKKDGSVLQFDSSDNVYLPIQHTGLTFYRDPLTIHD